MRWFAEQNLYAKKSRGNTSGNPYVSTPTIFLSFKDKVISMYAEADHHEQVHNFAEISNAAIQPTEAELLHFKQVLMSIGLTEQQSTPKLIVFNILIR